MTLSSALTTVQEKAKSNINILLVAMLVLLVLSLKNCFQTSPDPFALPHRTDTVYVAAMAQVKKIPAAMHWPVAVVTIYLPDTALRSKAEKEDILLSGTVQNGHAEITTISPFGEVKLFAFDIPDIPGIATIDATGLSFVPNKKAKRKKVVKDIWSSTKAAGTGAIAGALIGGPIGAAVGTVAGVIVGSIKKKHK